jgi:hypothetical protein
VNGEVTTPAAYTLAKLAALPQVTVTVSAGGVQAHTEVGPSLLEVLAAARVAPTLNTWVATVGDDNVSDVADIYVGSGPAS